MAPTSRTAFVHCAKAKSEENPIVKSQISVSLTMPEHLRLFALIIEAGTGKAHQKINLVAPSTKPSRLFA